MKNILSSEICRKCAQCCKGYPFIELHQSEIDALKKKTGLSVELFTNKRDEAGKEYFLQFKENGDCIFLRETNGGYLCGVYEARAGVCRNYPSNPNQEKHCLTHQKMHLYREVG